MSKSNLLIDETPMVFQPSLAKIIGLNEAIALQTLHYLCGNKRCGRLLDDERWIYNSYKGWREEFFPFWSERTIADVLRALESMGLVKSSQLDIKEGKAMKYYTVSQIAQSVLSSDRFTHLEDSSTWGGMLQDLPDAMLQDLPDHVAKNGRSARVSIVSNITKNHTETHAESSECSKNNSEDASNSSEQVHPTEKPYSGNSDSDFETFYSTYPRKVSKTNAEKSWKKQKCVLSEVMPSLQKQMKLWTDPQFIPHPATWINGRRWEDDLTTKLIPSQQTAYKTQFNANLAQRKRQWYDVCEERGDKQSFKTWVMENRPEEWCEYLPSMDVRWWVEYNNMRESNNNTPCESNNNSPIEF
jgi:hypothetical protein